MSVWFKSRLNPWYIWIPSNPNLYSTKIIMKMRWQTIASNVSIRTISPTATPLPKAYDCVAVYIAGRRTSLVVYGWWPQPPTKNGPRWCDRELRNKRSAAVKAGEQAAMCGDNTMALRYCREYRSARQRKERAYHQRVLMHRHQGWNVRHGLCHIYMRYVQIYELFIAFVCFVVFSLL